MRRRPPYWTVAVFVAVLAAPVSWAPAALVGLGLALTAYRLGRSLASRRAGARTAPEAIRLGTDARGREVSIDERELAAHGLILGASGAGKTTTLLTIVCDQVRRGRPVVALDMKGSPAFAAALADAAASAGRPFRIWTPDGPSHWNPLAHGNATELKDKLIATERFTEPHYQRAAERYVQTVLRVIEQSSPERPATLAEVVALMDPHRLAGSLRELPRGEGERVQDYLASLTPDQISAIRGLQTRLAIVTESHTGSYLEPGSTCQGDGQTGELDVRSALSGPEVLLFSLNSSTYGKLAAQLGTLVVQDLVCAAGNRLSLGASGQADDRGNTPGLTTVAIDESSVLGENLISLFARCREAGIGVLAATQEMADFDRVAPGLRDQVLGNTAFKVAHRQDVPSSAQTVAQMVGTEKAWEETEQIAGSMLGSYRTGRGTRRLGEQFVIHPNEIKTLGTGQAVLISKLRGDRARTVRVAPPRERGGPER